MAKRTLAAAVKGMKVLKITEPERRRRWEESEKLGDVARDELELWLKTRRTLPAVANSRGWGALALKGESYLISLDHEPAMCRRIAEKRIGQERARLRTLEATDKAIKEAA